MTQFEKELRELFELQKEFDARVIRDSTYPKQKMILAFIAELGELLKEQESLFKMWKKHPNDDRRKALEEYVDCLHIGMSLQINNDEEYLFNYIEDCEWKDFDDWNNEQLGSLVIEIIKDCEDEEGFDKLLTLGNLLGFTLD